ncbi:hypothetical protein THITH_05180 [Thioalkalivibrio paradoxus ARh 1]|uniref:Uncharacterized protein n=1 Tax=Thioalkalivibrio paradoxus ARh 1 TaxID=713585 RepID=W0DMZ5_9GAMM|nr:hypothetical protein THITH_05180 [Thioalkalivibrio paradoxus ARh 1]
MQHAEVLVMRLPKPDRSHVFNRNPEPWRFTDGFCEARFAAHDIDQGTGGNGSEFRLNMGAIRIGIDSLGQQLKSIAKLPPVWRKDLPLHVLARSPQQLTEPRSGNASFPVHQVFEQCVLNLPFSHV